jgi:NADPH:quinone reductase-like Zn-dependent oxidoreductase
MALKRTIEFLFMQVCGVGSFAISMQKQKEQSYIRLPAAKCRLGQSFGCWPSIDYKTEDYKEVANNLDIVFWHFREWLHLDAFEIIKEGGKVTTIVGPPDEETAKQMGMK